jgi:hypothetical protein
VSDIVNNSGESTKIESIESNILSAKIRMTMNDGLGFIIIVTSRGLEFYGTENSAGNVSGTPIVLTPDQVFECIKGKTPERGKKPFGRKKGLKRIGRGRL